MWNVMVILITDHWFFCAPKIHRNRQGYKKNSGEIYLLGLNHKSSGKSPAKFNSFYIPWFWLSLGLTIAKSNLGL